MKILFAHNSLPEYRLTWFKEISQKVQAVFLITNPQLAKKLYITDGEKYLNDNLNCVFLDSGEKGYRQLISLLKNEIFDFYELPPVDSVGEFIKSFIILHYAKKNRKTVGYFWEKWEAPLKYQTIKRRLKNRILGTVAKLIYCKADIIFSSGTKNREYFINNGVEEEKIVWIPDCCEIPICEYKDIRQLYSIPKDAKVFLYFGRIIKQKGLDVLIKAFSALEKSEMNKAFLLVVGDGPFREECEHMTRNLNVCNIKFCGRIEPHERYNYFNQCDVFVHPGTFFEGRTDVWGLTLNEAIQCGKTLIATDAVGSAYDLITEKNGYFVVQGDTTMLYNAIVSSINEEKCLTMVLEENTRLSKIYNSKNMAELYIRGIKRVKCLNDKNEK